TSENYTLSLHDALPIWKDQVDSSVTEFYKNYGLKASTAADFKFIVVENSTKDINWFFDEYVSTTRKIDFKIKKIQKLEDSLRVRSEEHTSELQSRENLV